MSTFSTWWKYQHSKFGRGHALVDNIINIHKFVPLQMLMLKCWHPRSNANVDMLMKCWTCWNVDTMTKLRLLLVRNLSFQHFNIPTSQHFSLECPKSFPQSSEGGSTPPAAAVTLGGVYPLPRQLPYKPSSAASFEPATQHYWHNRCSGTHHHLSIG